MDKLFANSEDPDPTPHSAASDLGLHCLPITLLGVSQIQWVKTLLGTAKSGHNREVVLTVNTYYFVFELEFYKLVNTVKVMSSYSVNLLTLF